MLRGIQVSDAAATHANSAAPSGERRQVTALFADMVGFTAISERLGEEGTFALIQPIYELMARAVREQGGSVKDFTGDGIMALFGAPDALEDAPLRACRAGLAIQERLDAAGPAIEAKHGVRPQMRIGLNSGVAVVTQIRGEGGPVTALGDTVNFASRLQTLAEPGTVYLSEATQRLVQGLVETTFAGDMRSRARPSRKRSIGSKRSARGDAVRGGGKAGPQRLCRARARAGRSERPSTRRAATSRHRPRGRAGHGQVAFASRVPAARRQGTSFHSLRKLLAGRPADAVPAIHRGGARLVSGESGGGGSEIARKLEMGLNVLGLHSPENSACCSICSASNPRRRTHRSRRRIDRPAYARPAARYAGSALPPLASGSADRGPALDRQRFARGAGKDRR